MLITWRSTELDLSEPWRAALKRAIPNLRVVPENHSAAQDASAAIVYRPTSGSWHRYPAIQAILNLGAGVETLLADPSLPDVPILKVIPPTAPLLMCEYVVYQVARIRRSFGKIESIQRNVRWEWIPGSPSVASTRILVLGLGRFGGAVARALSGLGYTVSGWSKRKKSIPNVNCGEGRKDLESMLPQTNILIALLPLTPETRSILSAALFARLPQGATVINVGRGECLEEEDLLTFLNKEHLGHAVLDVFRQEPLAPEHPFWVHPRITLTPHCAADPTPDEFAVEVRGCLEAIERGDRGAHEVDKEAGY